MLLGRAGSAHGRRRAYREALGAAAAVAGLLVLRRLSRLAVDGPSMRPGLQAGDRLLLVRRRRYPPGAVVAAPDPRLPTRLLVKRVAVGSDGRLELRGDDEAASTDSRTFGPVEARLVRGQAVWRYAPRWRRGRVR